MSAMFGEEEEESRLGGGRGAIRPKPRFSINEVRVLLQAVRKNRYIVLKRFNQGVSVELKKQTWAEITNQVNQLGENHREVRQIMKKWADLKCDGKRRMASMRGPNGRHLRKKTMGPVEMMVHKILTMSPEGGAADEEWSVDFEEEEDLFKLHHSSTYSTYSYLNKTEDSASSRLSPHSSSDKEHSKDRHHSSSDIDHIDDGESIMDLEDEDSLCLPLLSSSLDLVRDPVPDVVPDVALLRVRPLHTYSRNHHNQITSQDQQDPKPQSGPPSPPVASTSEAASSQAPPSPLPLAEPQPLPDPPSSPKKVPPPRILPSTPTVSDPLPAGGASHFLAQMASQSVAQQLAGRVLLGTVSRSLENLAQSVQLLVESQSEFVQESLLLQRETLDILKDFSTTALAMLRGRNIATPTTSNF